MGKTPRSQRRGTGLIPGGGTKIQHAMGQSKKKKKPSQDCQQPPVAGRDTEDFVPGAIREHRAHLMPRLWTSSPRTGRRHFPVFEATVSVVQQPRETHSAR